jgi:hypothetical protein
MTGRMNDTAGEWIVAILAHLGIHSEANSRNP